ncbi:MAG TPA: ankyrin repeat domain-containing protein [Polyangiaceae bacterium]|nr:ankyrin repeat domain-containing protein [Polyangiaceae bacterium]
MTDGSFSRAVQAAAAGEVSALEQLMRDDPSVLEARDADGHTLLGLACKAATNESAMPPADGTPQQHAAVDAILAAGADPSAAAYDGWAPLHTAAITGHVALMRRLLAAGASREGRLMGARGGSPLALSLFYAKAERVALLANPPFPDNLRTAAALNRPLERFIDGRELVASASEGTDFYRPISAFPVWQRTSSRQELLDEALSWAARNDACEAMATLVSWGADVSSNAYRGTPLLWAIYGDRVNAATWLLEHGADPNQRHDFGGEHHGRAAVALHLAAQYSCLGCLRLLLSRGADATIKDVAYDATPLGWAEHEGATEAAEILRAHRRR